MAGEPNPRILLSYEELNSDVVEGAEDKINSLSGTATDANQGFRNMADGAMMMADQFSAFGSEAIQKYASYDQAMANVNSIVVGTQAEMAELRELGMQIGREFPVSAAEAAQGFYQLASAGKSAADIQEISEQIMKASIATASDFATTANLVTAAQDTWGYSNQELNGVTDVLLNTVKGYKTTLPELGLSMGLVGTTAASLGIDMQTTAASIGMLRQAGLDASTAGSGMRMMMGQLAKSATATEGPLATIGQSLAENSDGTVNLARTMQNLQPVLAAMGSESERVAFLTNAFGARAATTATILVKNATAIDGAAAALGELGTTEEAFAVQADGAANKLAALQSAYDEQQMILGEQLIPAEIKMLEMKTAFLGALNKLPGPLGEYAGGIMMAASEISSFLGPMGMMLTGLSALNLQTIKNTASTAASTIVSGIKTAATYAATAAQWALNAAMYANPYVLIAMLIVALIVIIVLIIAYFCDWDDITNALNASVRALGDVFTWIGETAFAGIIWYVEVIIWEFNLLMDALTWLGDAFGEVLNWIGDNWRDVWDGMVDKVLKVLDFFLGLPETMKQAGQDMIHNFIEGLENAAMAGIDKVKDIAGNIAGFFGGSPPEYGPLKDAMDYGGKAFVERYYDNFQGSLPGGAGGDSSTWNGNFAPQIQNYNYGGGGETTEDQIRDDFERSLEIMRRQGRR